MPEEVQTFSKIQLLDGTVAEVRDNTKQEAPATAGQAGQVLGLDDNGDPAWLDSAGSVIPVFSRGQDGYECDMTFAEVYAAIQGNECTACVVQAAPGAIVMLQLYMASETDIAFCMTTSSDTGNITSVILSFTDDENVEFEVYQVSVAYLLSKPYGRSIFPVTAGSLCYSSGSLYKAKQDIAEYEEFTSAHWQITSVEEELDALRTMYRNIIAVQDATPTSPETMIWMPATQAAGIVVPTYAEYQAALSAKADKDDVEVASIAETQTIIDEWEEEGMVVEMTFVYDGTAQDPCDFVSVFDADDIIEAYQAGKNVVVHIPTVTSEESHGNAVPSNEYWTIDAYTSRADVGSETRVYYLSCGGIGSYEFDIGQDGKLHYTPYIG